MYTSYFGLEEKPFSIAPNPDYLFMSDRHREALNHLTYGLGDTGGFVLLTGEVGTGKTTISRRLMENLPENTQAAFILNPTLSSQELLATLCDELKIRYRKTGATLKTLTDKIQQKLLKNHSENINTLLIIDEAQHLQPEVLEQLRLLTNLETNTKKLLQVILIGQPELQQLLQRRDLRQLAQRITARYHLLPLNKQEVAQYLKHRLSVAKCFREIFDKSAVNAIHKTCKGIPRLMNLLAERSLMNAYNSNNAVVNRKMVLQAAYDALGDEFEVTPWWKNRFVKVGGLASALGLVLVIGVWWGSYQLQGFKSAPHLTAIENEDNSKLAQAVIQEKLTSPVDNNANALVQNTAADTQAQINQKTVSDNETVISNNKIESAELVDTAEQQLLATNKKILAAEKKLASLQIAQQQSMQQQSTEKQSADAFIEPEKKLTPKNFVVEAEEGVSDALFCLLYTSPSPRDS